MGREVWGRYRVVASVVALDRIVARVIDEFGATRVGAAIGLTFGCRPSRDGDSLNMMVVGRMLGRLPRAVRQGRSSSTLM